MNKGISLGYRERLRDYLLWYKSTFHEQRLPTHDGRTLRYACQKAADCRAAVIIVNGRTEYIEKYIELLRDLQAVEISFAIYDHCGQGDSGRLLEDKEKGHIEKFDQYVEDLGLVIRTSREEFGQVPLHLLCHSMGGTIAWLYCAEHPGAVESLILSAPMFSIETGIGIPLFMVESIARICCKNGMGERYVATTGPFNEDLPFEDNVLTTDPDRFAFNLYLAKSLPYARVGGPTYRWLCEAFTAMRRIGKVSDRIECPVRLFAGKEDHVVNIDRIEQAAQEVNGAYRVYENARHELFMESQEIRSQVLDAVRELLKTGNSSVSR